MKGKFNLMEGDVLVGVFDIDSEADKWFYTAIADNETQPLIFNLLLREQSHSTLEGEQIKTWITNRSPSPFRADIEAVMEKVGISEYDPLAVVAYNAGRWHTDKYYLIGSYLLFPVGSLVSTSRVDFR